MGVRVTINGEAFLSDQEGGVETPPGLVGLHKIEARQIGFVTIREEREIGRGLQTLREERPGSIALRVVDEDGAPVPFAALRVRQGAHQVWGDLQDGVQRMDLYCDETGARTLHSIAAGAVRVRARIGSRVGQWRSGDFIAGSKLEGVELTLR